MDSKTVESTVELVRSQFGLGYITSYKSNLERLEIKVQNLEVTKNSVQHSIDEAKRNEEKIVNSVLNWLTKVDATVVEAKNLIDNNVQENYMRYFPNLRFRHQHSKKSQKMIQEIHEVLVEGNFDRISKPSTLKEIQQALKHPNIYMIGLYGIDGVGKTTLVKELAWEVEKDGSFDVVVMVDVIDSLDVENIQGQIGNALGLKFDEETKEERVEQLRQRIRKEKNILFILDDIWVKVNLAELGIPFGDDHKGCKLLLIAEHLNVLKRQMGTQKEFRLEVLSDEDSWKLFEKIAGNYMKFNKIKSTNQELNKIKSIAQDVAKCCKGLPLFIVVVAKAFRKKNISTWKDPLNQLTGLDEQGLFKQVVSTWEDALNQLKGLDEQGFFKQVVCPLELSYHYLECDELRALFLFIVSFGPGHIHTGELFSCYWGLMGLYGDLHSLTEARNKYYKLINDLRASSLLLEVEIEYVKMHDAVRDMAKAISSRTHLTYEVRKFTQKEQWDMDQLKKCHYINLPSYNIDELPEKLDCPELKLMSLRRSHGYLTIPDNFFSGMREVKVLNLHGMRFAPSLPPSLRLLTNLVSLNLYGCLLKDIKIVAQLTRLEILTLERSEIQELPKEIGQLVHLRMLNLTNCCQLNIIPANLLSSLTRLEELYMGNCNIQWEVEGGKRQINNASLGELRNLNHVRTLDLSIHDASVLPADMHVFEKLQRYNIFIGNMWKWSSSWSGDAHETSRTLKLADSLNTEICLNHGVQLLFTEVEDLSLAKLNFVNDVSYELNGETFRQLRHLYIHNSYAFHNLETLILSNLHNMEYISYGPLATHCFEKLQVIKVHGCDKLKKLLLYSLAKNLYQLQEMEIFNCKVIEEIISEDDLEDENMHNMEDISYHPVPTHSFKKLQVIKVQGCYKLKKLLSYSLAKNLSQLQEMEIFNCKVMEEIIFEEKVKDENMHNMEDISYCPLATHSFGKLQVIKVQGCEKLKKLLPHSLAKNLCQLQKMEIFDCKVMEEIIFEEKLEDENMHNMEDISYYPLATHSFEKLQVIKVQGCDMLKKILFYSLTKNLSQLQEMEISHCIVMEEIISEKRLKDGKEFPKIMLPKLCSLTLDTLPKLRSFSFPLETNKDDQSTPMPLFNQKVTFPELKTLVILNMNNLKSIWHNQQVSNSFCKLNKIQIIECHALHHVFPIVVAKELQQLQVLEICISNIENIVEENYSQDVKKAFPNKIEGDAPGEIAFTKLEELKLEALPRLTNFFQESYNFNFPSLRTVHVVSCPNMKSLGHVNLTTIAQPEWRDKKGQKDDELNNMPIALLNEKVAMPNLENLRLSNIGSHAKIWDKKVLPFYSENLRDLIVNDYPSQTERLFSSTAARALVKLQHLEIVSCPNLVEIFVKQEEVTFPNLETLFINDMNGLKSIWNNQQAPNSFCKLNKIHIIGCRALHHVFPFVVAKELHQLQVLEISKSTNIKNIVEKSHKSWLEDKIVFMKLKELYLEHLLKLKSFCEESYKFKFPALQIVGVVRCPKLETFCHGKLKTPSLSDVQYGWNSKKDHRWDGNLNETLKRIAKEFEHLEI